MLDRIRRCQSNGPLFGLYLLILLLIDQLMIILLDIFQAKICKTFRFREEYRGNKEKFGDHLF